VDVTVSLPDEMRSWAKDEGLNLSQILRSAVQAERDRRELVSRVQAELPTEMYEYEMKTAGGTPYIARITGKLLYGDRVSGDHSAGMPFREALFLTADDQFVWMDGRDWTELAGDVADAIEFLSDVGVERSEYIELCVKHGIKPVITLGRGPEDAGMALAEIEVAAGEAKWVVTDTEAGELTLVRVEKTDEESAVEAETSAEAVDDAQ